MCFMCSIYSMTNQYMINMLKKQLHGGPAETLIPSSTAPHRRQQNKILFYLYKIGFDFGLVC